MLRQTLLALATLQTHRVTHRDVKPENLLLRHPSPSSPGESPMSSTIPDSEPSPRPSPLDSGVCCHMMTVRRHEQPVKVLWREQSAAAVAIAVVGLLNVECRVV